MRVTKQDLKSYDDNVEVGFIDGMENYFSQIPDVVLWNQLASDEVSKDNDNFYFSYWMINSIKTQDCPRHIFEGFRDNVANKK